MTDADPGVPDGASGALVLALRDDAADLRMVGGGSWTLPIGVDTLLRGELADAPDGRPAPEQLTNALGIVHDHLDDVIIAAPIVAAAPALGVVGDHAAMLARVEVGRDDVELPTVLARRDIDEVFRTLVVESRDDRVDNPGLDPAHVDSIVATCCWVLAFLRRLDLGEVTVDRTDTDASLTRTGGA